MVPRDRWHLLRAELRWAYRGRTEPRHSGHWVRVSHASAWLVLQGEAEIRTACGACTASRDQWLIAPPGERLQNTSADCEILSICFLWQWVFGRELFPLQDGLILPAKDEPSMRIAGLRLAAAARHLFSAAGVELPQSSGPITAHLELDALFRTWLAAFAGAVVRHGAAPCLATLDSRVEDAVHLIEHPHGSPLRPAELCRRFGLSQSQMNRLFVRELGTTVRNYCAHRRLATAQALLETPGLSVKETAFRLGFKSPQHFSHWFRLQTGVPPSHAGRGGDCMM